jgi:hypothetical protein
MAINSVMPRTFSCWTAALVPDVELICLCWWPDWLALEPNSSGFWCQAGYLETDFAQCVVLAGPEAFRAGSLWFHADQEVPGINAVVQLLASSFFKTSKKSGEICSHDLKGVFSVKSFWHQVTPRQFTRHGVYKLAELMPALVNSCQVWHYPEFLDHDFHHVGETIGLNF